MVRFVVVLLVAVWSGQCFAGEAAGAPAVKQEKSGETGTGSVSGRLVSNTGQPVAGARVAIQGGTSGDFLREETTKSDGTFAFEAVPPGSYTVGCRPPDNYAVDLLKAVHPITLEAGQQATIPDFRVQSVIRISGAVRDIDEKPIGGAEVRVENRDEGAKILKSAITRPDGSYELTTVPDGREYRIFAKAKGYYSGCIDIPEGAGDADGMNFVLGQGALLKGRAADTSGHAMRGGTIGLAPTTPQWNRRAGQMVVIPCDRWAVPLDDEGRFEFQSVGQGIYRFRVETRSSTSNYEQVSIGEPLTVKPGDALSDLSVLFTDPESESIEGAVRDETGAGVPDVDVDAITYEGVHWSAKTDASGHYRLLGLGDHTFDVYFMHRDYPDIKLPKIRPGARRADVVMAHGGTLSGTVLDAATQKAVPDAKIEVRRLEAEYGFDRGYRSEHQGAKGAQDGTFQLKGLLPGTAILSVAADGYSSKEERGIVIKAGQATGGLEFRLTPGIQQRAAVGDAVKKFVGPAGAIEGTVLSGGKPIEIEQFMGLMALDEPIHEIPAGYIIHEGKYRIEKLVPGKYEIWASARGNGHMAEEKKIVEIKPGETLKVDFALDFPEGKAAR